MAACTAGGNPSAAAELLFEGLYWNQDTVIEALPRVGLLSSACCQQVDPSSGPGMGKERQSCGGRLHYLAMLRTGQ